jgi:hypothetical protein
LIVPVIVGAVGADSIDALTVTMIAGFLRPVAHSFTLQLFVTVSEYEAIRRWRRLSLSLLFMPTAFLRNSIALRHFGISKARVLTPFFLWEENMSAPPFHI